jgi:murein DD-endopeptidase MepM/ murein hydrolase activator NlpD
MDRPQAHDEAAPVVLVIPGPGGEVVVGSAASLARGTVGRPARGAWFLVGVLFVALAMGAPRVWAYGGLVEENLALRGRLQDIDQQMADVDRMIKRLKLYDAQLKSLSQAQGDHGPLPDDAMTNGGLVRDLGGSGDGASGPSVTEAVPEITPELLRPAEGWAAGVAERVSSFLDLYQLGETDLDKLIAELESLQTIRDALPGVWPADGLITSGFGWRSDPVHGTTKFHSGLDIANDRGTAIYAVAPGRVILAESTSGYGRVVEIDHGFGITTRYAHCTTLRVRQDQLIERGDYIATMGSTGKSTGPHLHFELRIDGSAHDPLKYLPR